ncbi:MAG: type II toxin-antitoxin system YafQ family toxin [Campylobacteraceae bacterium]|jgi:mRNA interferase YafQ|nr:type II toxin-antitoxin system YafQ family toxin [Campylobacteraceae bacterium]
MRYEIKYTKQFKKDYKLIHKQGKSIYFDEFINILANDGSLDACYKDHELKGDYVGYRECHIKSDLLLIYKKQNDIVILTCLRLGSHSDLF